jgi:hypothetical protein
MKTETYPIVLKIQDETIWLIFGKLKHLEYRRLRVKKTQKFGTQYSGAKPEREF